ncbi:hypothetical protein CYMTET_5493 [Cymbomonas tetramitiformis]|uniref:Protein SirB1 N-terminal domain-containing protein n=1 Tax=Cymbomonas tetramitiformis TaxID=36881 RepID=A0AAE0GZB3_9CHLO|nr:hypothetical protein CYMTET_5493 [Cymbomonas tetramitiformis]
MTSLGVNVADEAWDMVGSTRSKFAELVKRSEGFRVESLGKAALLVALEDEATSLAMALEGGMSRGDAEDMINVGSCSTWTLGRLDSIAEEARAIFIAGMAQNGEKKPPQASDFPLAALEAINEVLFKRHGYKRPDRHHNGDPQNSLLPRVLEEGRGSPVLLGVLYMEIARRIGLEVEGSPLSEGPNNDYFILWPRRKLGPGGDNNIEMVVDAYEEGFLFKHDEILEMFDLKELQGASGLEILGSMLASLQDAHWAKAIECRPEPAYLKRISLEAAVDGQRGVLPEDARLDAALLAYHNGDLDTAWIELGALEECLKDALMKGKLNLLMGRIRFLLDQETWTDDANVQ